MRQPRGEAMLEILSCWNFPPVFGLAAFDGRLVVALSQVSSLCLAIPPIKPGFGHQMTSKHPPGCTGATIFTGSSCAAQVRMLLPGERLQRQNKPTQQHTLLVIYRFYPQTTAQFFQGRLQQAQLHPYGWQFCQFPCSATI